MKNQRFILYSLAVCLMILPACEGEQMKVATGEVTDIYPTAAKITGYLLSAGDGIKNYGHCYSKTPGSSVSDYRTEFDVAIGIGSFTSFLQNLEPGTKYFIKAYIRRNNTIEYGKEIDFTTTPGDQP